MKLGKVSNVSFGYKITPEFRESARWCHGEFRFGQTLINQLETRGNRDTIIHAKGDVFDNKDYDIMIFRKYKHKKRVYGGLRTLENLDKAEKEAMAEILQKAAKRGDLKNVKKSLLEDFPTLKKTIVDISKSPLLKNSNLSALKKGKNTNIFNVLMKYLKF